MRRWNGWGEETTTYEVPPQAREQLRAWLGPGSPQPDAKLEDVLKRVPPSRVPPHDLLTYEPFERVLHSRGQSLPDWVSLRSGHIEAFPDAVAVPSSDEHVRAVVDYAKDIGAALIPYGGGTSVVGHVTPLPGEQPVITVDMERLSRLRRFDDMSLTATFGAGVKGPQLEALLRAHNCTLGHYPQSFEYSTLGGWIATRSSGQQSLGFGRIEDLFLGGKLEAPRATLQLSARSPASAAGPDFKQLVLGSEGRLGILTEATVRVVPLPEHEEIFAVFFPDFATGCAATRQMVQEGLPLSMLRLSTARETETTLVLAGHPYLLGALERLLSLRGVGQEKAMLLIAYSGPDALARRVRRAVLDIAGAHGGVNVGRTFGQEWQKNRFHTPYLRNSLWELGYAVDTLETAVTWRDTGTMIEAIEEALHTALAEEEEAVHAFTHLSHFYSNGCSVYSTYLFRRAPEPERTLERWRRLKAAASQAIVRQGATISHQHGVGLDHAPYMEQEKGRQVLELLEKVFAHIDPDGLMNPGKLLPASPIRERES